MKKKTKNTRESVQQLYKKLYGKKEGKLPKEFEGGGFWNQGKETNNSAQIASTANTIGTALSASTSAFNQPSNPEFAKAAQGENAIMQGVSAIPVIGGIIGGVDAIGEAIGGPIRKNLEQTDHAGNINNPGAVKAGAIIGGILDPIKALTTRASYKGGFGDISGDKYVAHLEQKDKEAFRAKRNADKNAQLTAMGEAPLFSKGGTLERYNLPTHAQQDSNNINSIMDGQGSQFDKRETKLNGKNGEQDFAFSDNLMFGDKTLAAHSNKVDSKWAGRNDKISQDSKKEELDELKKINNVLKDEIEQKEEFKAFKKSMGDPQKFWEGGTDEDEIIYDYNTPSTRPNYRAMSANMSPEEFNETVNKKPAIVDRTIPPVDVQKPNLDFDMNKLPNLDPYQNIKGIAPTTLENYKEKEIKEKGLRNKFDTSFLEAGNAEQLAGMIPGTVFNLVNALKPADKVKAKRDDSIITKQQVSPEAALKEARQSFAQFKDALVSGGSIQGRANNAAMGASKTQEALGKIHSDYDMNNKGLQSKFEADISKQKRYNNLEESKAEDLTAQNKAAKIMFGAKAATQFGQGITEFGKAKKSDLTNKIGYKVLSEMYPDFTMAKYDEILKNKGNVYQFRGDKVYDSRTGKEVTKN